MLGTISSPLPTSTQDRLGLGREVCKWCLGKSSDALALKAHQMGLVKSSFRRGPGSVSASFQCPGAERCILARDERRWDAIIVFL